MPGKFAFYSAVAQIIPALVVAFSIQAFSWRRNAEQPGDDIITYIHVMASVLPLSILALGEFVSLRYLYNGTDTRYSFMFSVAALMVGLLSFCVSLIENIYARKPGRFSKLTIFMYLVVMLIVFLTSFTVGR